MKKFLISEYKDLKDLSDYEMTPKQAIIANRKECCGFSMHEAILCNAKTCALHNLLVRYTKNNRTRKKMQANANNQETDFDD